MRRVFKIGQKRGDILLKMEQSVEIKASPEQVWEMLAFDKQPEWMDVAEMKSAKYTSNVSTSKDKFRIGATVHIIEEHREQDVDITDSLENQKLTFRSKPPTKPPYTATFTLEPIEGKTKLTFVVDAEVGTLAKILGKPMISTMRKKFGNALEKLKRILEK